MNTFEGLNFELLVSHLLDGGNSIFESCFGDGWGWSFLLAGLLLLGLLFFLGGFLHFDGSDLLLGRVFPVVKGALFVGHYEWQILIK